MDIRSILDSLVGDTPVSEQICIAIEKHVHNDYVPREEFDALKQEIERLGELVGDAPVSEQIATALNL